jgi:hypothetical protein
VPAGWRALLGADYDAVAAAFLRPTAMQAGSYPCPRQCGCAHRVVRFPDGKIVAACECDPWNCDDLRLQPEDAVLWEVNWTRFSAGLRRAFELDRIEQDFGLPRTRQIGTWSADAVPVILTIQSDRPEFREVVAHLAAGVGRPFILLAPTSRFVDVSSLQLLRFARAAVFGLDTQVTLMPSGLLRPRRRPGEIFAAFADGPKAPVEETARQAFAMVKALDAKEPQREASLLTVFRLYCVEGLSAEVTAQRCGCSKGTILNRLNQIRRRIGVDPGKLRAYSAQFEAIEKSLSDDRARRIHRRSALDDPEEDDDPGGF